MPFNSFLIDYSNKVDPQFKAAFTDLYLKYLISAKVAYYSRKIGIYLSFTLSNLNTVFQASQYFLHNYLQLQYICSMINSCVICLAGLVFGISDAVAKRRKNEINFLLSSNPKYFDKPPFLGIGDEERERPEIDENKVQNYSKRICIGLSALLSGASTTLQIGNFSTQLQLIISLINSFVILAGVVLYRTSGCCKPSPEEKEEKRGCPRVKFFRSSKNEKPESRSFFNKSFLAWRPNHNSNEAKTHAPNLA